MSITHHWKMMSYHHYTNNSVAHGRFLFQSLDCIWRHHIVVQIAQENQYSLTKVWCDTFPTCNKDQQ